jgi:DNA-binding NarL/FixJ family response regulator
MKILIIDANQSYQSIYSRKFTHISDSISLKFIDSLTKEATKLLKSFRPDVVLVNHKQKRGYGSKVYDKLRKAGYEGKIAIAIAGQKDRVNRFQYNGIAGILDKSAGDEDFVEKFKEIARI